MGQYCITCGRRQNRENEKYQHCRDCFVEGYNKEQRNNNNQTKETGKRNNHNNKTKKKRSDKGLEIDLKNPIVSFLVGCLVTWILMTII